MSYRVINIIIFMAFAFSASIAFASEFDELEKAPEGAHSGQMLIGAFVFIGWQPYGNFIDAENDFLESSIYAFDSDTQKAIEVSHLYLGLGLSFEYMPFDRFGATVRLRQDQISQHTNFGPDYENWKGTLYRGVTLLIGPTIHATIRKRWDFVLIPLVGYNYAKYAATPVAREIIANSTGDRKRSSKGLSYGAELNCTLYFSGGLFISLGAEWIANTLKFDKPLDLQNPQTDAQYAALTEGNISSINVVITAGYALSN